MSARSVQAHHHWHVARFSLARLRVAYVHAQGFNAKLAVLITHSVGTMECAYLFTVLALVSLPAVLQQAGFVPPGTFPGWLISVGLIALVAWIAQTFLQLVLLSIIIVGQRVDSAAGDARAQKQFEDTETILDRLDLTTAGGLKAAKDEILAAIASLKPPAA